MSFSLHRLPSWTYKFMLVLAAAIWGLGTVAIKDSVGEVPPSWIVGFRFAIGGTALLILFHRTVLKHISRESLIAGAFLGVWIALSYLFNGEGLANTTASNSSFLTATYCVITPFLAWIISRARPTRWNILAAVLCITGVGFISLAGNLESFSIGYGDAVTLVSAFWIAIHLVFQAKLSIRYDTLTLTVIQFIVAGIIGCVVAAVTEGAPDPVTVLEPTFIRNVLYLALFAGCISLSLQNIGLAHVPAGPASLLLATESVFGVIFSVVLLGEVLTPPMVCGFVLIAASVVISETFPLKKKRLDPEMVMRDEIRASEG